MYMKKVILIIVIVVLAFTPINFIFSAYKNINLSESEKIWLRNNKGKTFTLATEDSDNLKYYLDKNGNYKGEIIDVANIIEKNLGIKIKIVPFENITEFVSSIGSNTYDIYYGPLKNDYRSKYLNFIKPTAYFSYKMITFDENIRNIYDLKNTKIGFIKNDFIYDEIAKKNSKYFVGANLSTVYNNEIVFFPSRRELERALIDNDVDVIIEASISNQGITLLGNIFELDEFEMPRDMISVNKNEVVLYSILKKLIISDKYSAKQIYDKNKSEFNLYKFYSNLNEKEFKWLEENNCIYFKGSTNLEPFIYKIGNKTKGIIYEYIKQMESDLGIEIKEYINQTNAIIINPFIVYYKNNEEYQNHFPYFPFSISIVGNKAEDNIMDLHELENNTVAMYEKDPMIYYLSKYYPNIKIDKYTSIKEAFRSVNKKHNEYTLNSKYITEYYLNNYIFNNLYNVGSTNDNYGYMISSNSKILNSIINKYIIYNNLQKEVKNIDNNNINYRILIAIVIPLLIIIAVILILYRNLSVETKKRIEIEKQEKVTSKKFENILLAIVESLERATAYSDNETGQHTRRIASYCRFLATQLGYSQKEIDEIANYSQLHDIGKIGVSETILKKPSKLNDTEYEEIKKHVKFGFDMIKPLELGAIAENIILYHHERWDGYGYFGLEGNQIPLESLIVCLADSYDAMRMKRVYKEKMTHIEAIEEIKNNSGFQFAPGVVSLFLKYNMKFNEIFEENK